MKKVISFAVALVCLTGRALAQGSAVLPDVGGHGTVSFVATGAAMIGGSMLVMWLKGRMIKK